MLKKAVIILFITLLSSVNVSALDNINIEIFDINKGCVIKKLESNPTIQNEVENYLKGITGVFAKLNPIPNKGYMIKIPLEEPIRVQNQWLSAFVEEVIIIFPENERPYIIVFDNNDRAIFLCFTGNTDVLLKNLNFTSKISQ